MARKSDAFPSPFDEAALAVVTSLEGHNLAEGTSQYVLIPRALINQLRAEINHRYPGAIDRTYVHKRRAAARKAS